MISNRGKEQKVRKIHVKTFFDWCLADSTKRQVNLSSMGSLLALWFDHPGFTKV